jgi:hypothetical protein
MPVTVTNMDEELRSWKAHFSICDAAHEALRTILLKHGILLVPMQRSLGDETLAIERLPCPDARLDYSDYFSDAQAGNFVPEPAAAEDVPLMNVRKSERGDSTNVLLMSDIVPKTRLITSSGSLCVLVHLCPSLHRMTPSVPDARANRLRATHKPTWARSTNLA